MEYYTLSDDAIRSVWQELAYPLPGTDGTLRSVPLRLRREEVSQVKACGQQKEPSAQVRQAQDGHWNLYCYQASPSAHLWSMRQRNQLEDGVKPETVILRVCGTNAPDPLAEPDRQDGLLRDSTLALSLGCAQGDAAAWLSPMVEFFAVDGIPIQRTRVVAVLTVMQPAFEAGDDPGKQEALLRDTLHLGLSIAAQEGYRFLVLPMDSEDLRSCEPILLWQALLEALRKLTSASDAPITRWQLPFDAMAVTHSDTKAYQVFRDSLHALKQQAIEAVHRQIADSIQKDRERYLSAIRGSLLAGAIGDALGYPVEFDHIERIRDQYGPLGIRQYKRSRSGQALISDDTQMTLFTAAGLLRWDTRLVMSPRKICTDSDGDILDAYQDWYMCQCGDTTEKTGAHWLASGREKTVWLSRLPQMFSRRAPGNTCLSALQSGEYGTIDNPINNSKGCGGVMRVAPVGLYHKGVQTPEQLEQIGWEAANAAALTHGHPLGYIPAAALGMMVNRAAFGGCPYGDGLYGILREANERLRHMFGDEPEVAAMEALLEQAVAFSRNHASDTENIPLLGEGWVAEEALAIAVYCCLRHPDDLDAALLAAVNHSGDSDSTGAIAGNLLGAWLGAEAIHPRWLDNLELLDVLEETALDLCDHCRIDRTYGYLPQRWLEKYWQEGLT